MTVAKGNTAGIDVITHYIPGELFTIPTDMHRCHAHLVTSISFHSFDLLSNNICHCSHDKSIAARNMSAVLVDLTLIDALGFVATKTAKIRKTLNMPPPTHWEYGNMYHYFLNVAEH